MKIVPLSLQEAKDFVREHHRHNANPPAGHKFSIGVVDDEDFILGVAMVGRPVARAYDDGWTLEVNRTCTNGTENVNSMLYGAARRAAKAMGYTRLITYTREDESGTSLRAAGWKMTAVRPARTENWGDSRQRVSRGTGEVTRLMWEAAL